MTADIIKKFDVDFWNDDYQLRKKQAILTIDDAPSNDFVKKTVFLKSLNIPAIFFCTGRLLQLNYDAAVEAVRDGFLLGNHAWNHPHFSDIPLKECETEIRVTSRLIDRVYEEAGVQRPAKFFRFPYGDKGDGLRGEIFKKPGRKGKEKKLALQKILRSEGYTFPLQSWINYPIFIRYGLVDDVDWLWSFDVMEWSVYQKKPVFGIDSLLKAYHRMRQQEPKDCRGDWKWEKHWLGSNHPEIILMHDHMENAALFSPLVTSMLKLSLNFPPFASIL